MNEAVQPPARRSFLWAGLLVTGAAVLAITNQSFWIDESVIAIFAGKKSLAQCWGDMKRLHFPEIQAPLYMAYAWCYIKIFGSTEWVLRAAGLPWFVAGATIFAVGVGRAIGSTLLSALAVAWSGFAWYYLNEARVYATQLGLALAVIGAAAYAIQLDPASATGRNWARTFLFSLFLLCASSVLAAAWGFFMFLALLAVMPRSRWLAWCQAAPLCVFACAFGLAATAGYYAWTMTLEAKPTTVGATNPKTIIFVFYELLGAAGLGPARHELREAGAGALKPFAPALGVFAVITAFVLWNGIRELFSRFGARSVFRVGAIMATPFIFLCVIGVLTRFRVLGRHMTPLLPILLVVIVFGIFRLAGRPGGVGRLAAGLFFVLNLASCLSLRWATRHEKDDYRGAAAIAKAATAVGQTVWWSADAHGAEYYKLIPVTNDAVKVVMNPTRETLRELPEPNVVISSKPDTYDNGGQLNAYVHDHGYRGPVRLSAFEVWTKN